MIEVNSFYEFNMRGSREMIILYDILYDRVSSPSACCHSVFCRQGSVPTTTGDRTNNDLGRETTFEESMLD